METVESKYKVFGGFSLLIALNVTFCLISYKLLFDSNISIATVDFISNRNAILPYLFVFGFQTMLLVLFTTQNRYIIADKTKVTFINPMLPFMRHTCNWTDYDYYVTIHEQSRGSNHEAVWLIKNNKIKDRFSSFYYSNYESLKNEVQVKYRGEHEAGPIKQLTSLMGMKIK